MKGLFLAFGLIAALFISNNVQASIYDTATYQAPKTDSIQIYNCYHYNGNRFLGSGTYDQCITMFGNHLVASSTYPVISEPSCVFESNIDSGQKFRCTVTVQFSPPPKPIPSSAPYLMQPQSTKDTLSCPPDNYPNYTFERDTNNDGKIDQCYDPRELDNVSKCADLFNSGSMLSTGNNIAPLVCKEFEDGSRCAFSRVNQGTTPYYQPNLEVGCFGDGNPIPKYEPSPNDPQPQPEQCVPYAGGYACAADPKNYCSSEFECVDGCGYFNKQFICFRDEQCTGASCSPAPVDCTTVPDAPVCKDQATTPEPSFCEKNPTVQSCQSGSNFCKKNPLASSCQLGGDNGGGTGGGGGGSDFSLDYEKLINGMKDAAKSLIDSNETPEFSDFQSKIDDKTSKLDSEIDNFMNGSHFDGINEQIGSNIFSGQFQLPTGGGCTPFYIGEHQLDLCEAAQKISSVLYFVFAFLTLLHLKNLFYSTVTPRKE